MALAPHAAPFTQYPYPSTNDPTHSPPLGWLVHTHVVVMRELGVVILGGDKKGWTDRCASEMHRPSVALVQQAEEEHRVAKSSLTLSSIFTKVFFDWR